MRPGLVAAAARGGPKKDRFELEHLTDGMMDLAVAILAAALLAIAITLAVRLLGGRWSWPLAGLPLVTAALPFSVFMGVALTASLILAAGLGFAWHRQDLERGGVEAQVARERSGPFQAATAALRRRSWRAQRVRDGRLALGQTPDGRVRTVPFGELDGTRAFVLGAPGSGKTVTLMAHALAYVGRGYPVVCVDPKGDRPLRDGLRAAAERAGRPFYAWSPDGSATYNPLARGSASEIADKALAGEEWTEPHYLRQAQRYLGLELQAMHNVGRWPPTLGSVAAHLEPGRLDVLVDEADEDTGARVSRYLEGLSPRARAELGGVRDRLAILCESELGRWLEPRDGTPEIELGGAMAEGAVSYFQLDADRFPLASQMLGAAIVVDLVTLTGELQGRPLRGLVLVDEFAAVAAEEISRLLSRSRSAGLSVLLATQAFADLSVARLGDGTESLRRQVLSHVDYVIAHRQSEPEAAELLGQMAGTKPAWAVARRVGASPSSFWGPSSIWGSDDQVTRRRTREFVRHPDEFKALGVGEAIVIEPASARRAERVQIWAGLVARGER